MRYPEIYTGLRAPPKGVLLFGPPGTGKTLLARAVAVESGATFFALSASTLMSKWVGDGEKRVAALFRAARKLGPSIVFLDEVDSVLSARAAGENESSTRMKTEFLVQLDGVGAEEEGRVLVLAATNRPAALDDAVLRRLPRRVYIPLPETGARAQLLASLLRDTKHSLSRTDLTAIATATEGFSGSDLKELAREAAHAPVREARALGRTLSVDSLRPVHRRDLEAALAVVRPSVDPTTIEAFNEYNEKFGSKV